MARRSILGIRHPSQITLVMPTEKGTSGPADEAYGLFGQSAAFLIYLQAEAIVYVLGE